MAKKIKLKILSTVGTLHDFVEIWWSYRPSYRLIFGIKSRIDPKKTLSTVSEGDLGQISALTLDCGAVVLYYTAIGGSFLILI
jgi:hypothetical protein